MRRGQLSFVPRAVLRGVFIGLMTSCGSTSEVTTEHAVAEPVLAAHGPHASEAPVHMEHGIQFVDAARSIGPSIVSFSAPEPRVLGSGVVLDSHGHILTNNHILAGADSARVRFQDGREAVASVVGSDPKADLALVRVAPNAGELRPATLGDSDRLEIGEWVLSVGSPPGSRISVSVGVVSAIGRGSVGLPDHADLIHTDANINAGNSGGPLVDRKGRVVGINTAPAAHGGAGQSDLGFAIPINMAKQVAAELIAKASHRRGDVSVD